MSKKSEELFKFGLGVLDIDFQSLKFRPIIYVDIVILTAAFLVSFYNQS